MIRLRRRPSDTEAKPRSDGGLVGSDSHRSGPAETLECFPTTRIGVAFAARSTFLFLALSGAVLAIAPACGLEDAPLGKVDISDLQSATETAVLPSAEEQSNVNAAQTSQAVQQSAVPAATTSPSPSTQQTPAPAAGSSSSTDVTVEITDNGLGGQSGRLTLTLKKGSKYRIKLVNNDSTGDNVHIISFSGLNLPEIQLNAATPTAIVDLSADVPGRYGFSCENQWCTIHPKMRGTLVIEE